MLGIRCSGSKKTALVQKIKAKWVGSLRLLITQYLVSIKSHVINPFVTKRDDAAKIYFRKIYSEQSYDNLLFDTHNWEYYDKTKLLLDSGCKYDCVYDLGCGEATFIKCLEECEIKFEEYIGIDYATEAHAINIHQKVENMNVIDYQYNNDNKSKLFFLSNIICYLSEKEIRSLFQKICVNDKKTTIIIVDPIPSLFWDATFENVQLYYRRIHLIEDILKDYGYEACGIVKDYLLQIGNVFALPLSYAIKFVGM